MACSHKQPDLERFGYSSSSDSDDAARKTTTSSGGTTNQKKKKKKKPPQQSINRIWRRFTSKQSSKALSVLPFEPVPLPSTIEAPNEAINAGYEKARDECSRRVKKIIQECKRVNTRYRDPNFDLDWDLKMGRGNCLNFLGSSRFDMSNTRYSTTTSVPKCVKRVREIFEKPTYLKDIDGADIKQGGLGNCWFIASLSALANVEDAVKRVCVEYDTRIGIYGFVFFRDGEWIYSIIDDKLYLTSPNWDNPSMQRDLLNQIDRESPEKDYRKTYQTGSKALFFGQCKNQNETWVALIEKAYAKAHGDFGSLSGGWIGEGLEDLTGGVTTELLATDILDLDEFWENEMSKVNQEFFFGCSTGLLDGGYGYREGIREGHAYVVMDARTLKNGERLVKLRNPWGKTRKGIWEGAWSDGSKEWNSDVKEELGHQFGNDSVFWIRYEDMIEKYQHFDRTRLFRDADWYSSQRWIGVEVPWKPQWNEKFHIKLTKESPLVLTLQQLDTRYYKGLIGQYYFRLHFRIHEQGRPDSEDYIVRSHGNYLMNRSVSIEIPMMEPGNYSVFLSVTAERDTDMLSVEDVVKRECKKREENDKFAKVGYAYDLAHSKGVAHLEHVANLRKSSDQKKASASRQVERRKMWEKRHLNREIAKKQSKKNQEKRDKRREAEGAKKAAKAAAQAAEAAKRQAEVDAEAAAKKAKEEAEAYEKKQKEEAVEAERKKHEDENPKDAAIQTDNPAGEDKSSQKDTAKTESDAAASATLEKTEEKVERTTDESTTPDKSEDGKESTCLKEDDTPQVDVKEAPSPADEKPVDVKPEGDAKLDADSNKEVSSGTSKTAPTPAPAQAAAYSSDGGDSSDSPVEDWELLYSSDDMSKKPRMASAAPPPTTTTEVIESDGESALPDPWNATCIVGFRVCSKDPDLDLRVVIEGGDLAEGGMGSKGAADIDNAQINAAGEREKDKDVANVTDEVEIVDGEVVTKKKIVIDEKTESNVDVKIDDKTHVEQDKDVDDGNVADTENDDDDEDQDDDIDAAKSDTSDSTDSTPIYTPDSTTDSTDCNPQHTS
ncbi:cysteine proteinase [Xylariaceae sp. FL1019]|nr:cysteine proteinase [Xylariaceae sp. FL1019]